MRTGLLALSVALALAAGCGAQTPPPKASADRSAEPEESDPAPKKKKKKAEEPAEESEPAEETKAPPRETKPEPPAAPPLPRVEFVERDPAPSPSKLPQVSVKAPTKNQVIPAAKADAFDVKLDVRDWDLSAGNEVHVIVDNRPYVRVADPKKPIKLADLGKHATSEGHHVLVALPAHKTGEAVRPSGKRSPLSVVHYFVGKKGDLKVKEKDAWLVFHVAPDTPAKSEGLVVDFFPVNAEIADGKYVVHAAVTGPEVQKGESISSHKPWVVKNARPGVHTVRLQLFHYEPVSMESSSSTSVSYGSKQVPGVMNSTTHEVKVVPN